MNAGLTYALTEEIGDPELFVGRKQEMAQLLEWAEGAKRRISLSTGILSRRKKGKTALLQRFFNILYTRNDPQLIPFYFRIPEERLPKPAFARSFYRRLLSQYFGFTTRTPAMVDQVLSFDELNELAANDPYVASDVRRMEEILETVVGKGEIARVWNEYLWDAFARVNDTNARKIVLYLAAHEPEERGRDQILNDLKLDMTDQQLEERLHKLVKADILADGSTRALAARLR